MSNRLYTSIPAPKVPRNTFNRTRPNTLSIQFQRAYPTLLEEILPGDLFRIGAESFARLQPLQAPVMNEMRLSQHYFFVPLRTINKHFGEFMWNNRNGDYSEVLPYTHTDVLYNVIELLYEDDELPLAAELIRLYDFIGLPFVYNSKTTAQLFVRGWLDDPWNIQVSTSAERINLSPFVAYQKIWNEYYRDENVSDDVFDEFEKTTGYSVMDLTGDQDQNVDTDYMAWSSFILRLRPRAWAHDRFTSCLPFAQRGPDVLLPIAGSADVSYKDGFLLGDTDPKSTKVVTVGGNPQLETHRNLGLTGYTDPAPSGNIMKVAAGSGEVSAGARAAYDPNGSLEVDFDNAELTTTINAFRRAERVQRWYENSARGGVRPNEATLSHFGVKTPDASLDRAEFLGGHKQPIVISEVAQTSQTTDDSPQGTLAGKATSYKSGMIGRFYFSEHGFLFCLTSALVRANYWQGIPRLFSRMQRDEYYWPEFANLGEEPVFTKELYAGQGQEEDTVFGYVPRYADYKTALGEVHGDMRSSMAFWTQTREFANAPKLNEDFLFADPSLSPFALGSYYTDLIILTIQNHVKASRLMPFYGVPTI